MGTDPRSRALVRAEPVTLQDLLRVPELMPDLSLPALHRSYRPSLHLSRLPGNASPPALLVSVQWSSASYSGSDKGRIPLRLEVVPRLSRQ